MSNRTFAWQTKASAEVGNSFTANLTSIKASEYYRRLLEWSLNVFEYWYYLSKLDKTIGSAYKSFQHVVFWCFLFSWSWINLVEIQNCRIISCYPEKVKKKLIHFIYMKNVFLIDLLEFTLTMLKQHFCWNIC